MDGPSGKMVEEKTNGRNGAFNGREMKGNVRMIKYFDAKS